MPCRFLSAGQRRRLALARLVASTAPLWLLDEPLTGLDADSVADLHAAIAAHRETGGCVALSTHAALALVDAVTLSLEDYAPALAPAGFAL
jgi:heme exporter protein A